MAKERSLAEGFQVFATKSSYWVGSRWAFALAVMTIFLWGKRAALPLLGYLATSCEHRDNYRDFSYGVSHPEHSKSGR